MTPGVNPGGPCSLKNESRKLESLLRPVTQIGEANSWMMQSGPGNSRYGRVNNDSFRRRVAFRLALEQLWCKRVPPIAGFDKLPGKSNVEEP
jgi:hypothetical protein